MPHPAGATISLHPAETRTALVRLLAILILFAVVRNNLVSVAVLRRLSFVVFLNGFLLALFAVVQFFSSSPNTVFWKLPTLNLSFGPFLCKNHFPFYLSQCIGLGAGLLFSLRPPEERHGRARLFNLPGLLSNPGTLWCAFALAFMIGSVALSMSRGGLLSFAAAAAICWLLHFLRTRRASRVEIGILVGITSLVVVALFGLEPILARLATLWHTNPVEEARLPLWWDLLDIVKRFPLWGTGYGSHLWVELTFRTRPASYNEAWENSHNEYLEALVEGGVVRLLLTLALVAMVCRLEPWRRCTNMARPQRASC